MTMIELPGNMIRSLKCAILMKRATKMVIAFLEEFMMKILESITTMMVIFKRKMKTLNMEKEVLIIKMTIEIKMNADDVTITMKDKVLVIKHDKSVMNKLEVTKDRSKTSILLVTEDTDTMLLMMLTAMALTNF